MKNDFISLVESNKTDFFNYLNYLSHDDKKLFVHGELTESFKKYEALYKEHDGLNIKLIELIQESFLLNSNFYSDVREIIGESRFFKFNMEEIETEEIPPKEYLIAKEILIAPDSATNTLTLNFKPFYEKSPLIKDARSIGSGVEFLNKFLSSQMFNNTDKWRNILFNFIRLHSYGSEQLILGDRIKDIDTLLFQIDNAISRLEEHDEEEEYIKVKHLLQDLGFEKGLGNTVGRIIESLKLLSTLFNSPDHVTLSKFISRIPMIFKIVIVSPHGYFGQEGVLGLPDTGGQVVYILDQVKALEKILLETLKNAGLEIMPKIIILTRLIPDSHGTPCNKRLEKVYGTKNTWILRVPFREHNKKVTDKWISRFEIWPYLDEFADDSFIELSAEFGGRPDLVIGNYSDGNLVSYLLSRKFEVTQCCIAHAIEKSKYLFSGLYWKDLEEDYHFSVQFTADLLAINSADFLITSSYQEITGTEKSIGQYETYRHFTMPGLYRVVNGLDPHHPKFNILSPGVNDKIYFPYTRNSKRILEVKNNMEQLLFGNIDDPEVLGRLDKADLYPIFSMARLDRVKNLTTLVKWFGESDELRNYCNLIIVAGKIDATQSTDKEEIGQIHLMHDLINRYHLHNQIRWIGKLFRKDRSGEVYRVVADRKGIFVQPALFEGFGLTVLEAMVSGLPVFATKYGGPLEIIVNRKSGFHIDPVDQEESTGQILNFIQEIDKQPEKWDKISKAAIDRVNESYNWKMYSSRLLKLAKIYGFWKFSSNMDMQDRDAYLDLIYHLLIKPVSQNILIKHSGV